MTGAEKKKKKKLVVHIELVVSNVYRESVISVEVDQTKTKAFPASIGKC